MISIKNFLRSQLLELQKHINLKVVHNQEFVLQKQELTKLTTKRKKKRKDLYPIVAVNDILNYVTD